GRPANSAAWRAGACPTPAGSTMPMCTSPTSPGATPARSSAALIAVAPSRVAGTPASDPRKLPMAGRAAPTITTARMGLGEPAAPRAVKAPLGQGVTQTLAIAVIAGPRSTQPKTTRRPRRRQGSTWTSPSPSRSTPNVNVNANVNDHGNVATSEQPVVEALL